MKFISYAQNFEDLMLWRALGERVSQGFYVDVGANDPLTDSITKHFYDHGWHGINVEPLRNHWDDLQRDRERDTNLCVALGEASGEIILWDFDVRGWSTADTSVAENHSLNGHSKEQRVVPVTTLSEVLEKHASEVIHFLKIDVEGFESNVLQGADFEKFRPWIILVESTLPNSKVQCYEQWEPILLRAGYHFCYFDGLNRFYVANEHSDLDDAFAAPPNVFDEFVLYREVEVQNRLEQAILEVKGIDATITRTLGELELQKNEAAMLLQERSDLERTVQALQAVVEDKTTESEALKLSIHTMQNSRTWRCRDRVISMLRNLRLMHR